MNRKIKVAHIQLLPLLTGVQRVTLDELERLDPKKFDKYLICKEEGPLTLAASSKGVCCLYNPFLVREISFLSDIKALWKLYRLFKENNFDIVHSHSSKTGVIGRIAARLARVPMIVHTVHGFAFPAASNRVEKIVFWLMEWLGTICSHKVVCLHDADKNIAINKLRAPISKLEVLANGVDTLKFSPPEVKERLQIREKFEQINDDIIVGMVGRLWKQKNPTTFVKAAVSILSSGINAQFVVVGDGDLRKELETIISRAGCSKNIHLLGWRDDTVNLLKSMDIFVLPSLWEGMPLAILEAQSTGLPCIVSDIQGNNSLVEHEVDGLLFECQNSVELASMIKRLIDDKTERLSMGKLARKKILNSYDIDKRIERIGALYEKNFVTSKGASLDN